jgi:hypothetical protein
MSRKPDRLRMPRELTTKASWEILNPNPPKSETRICGIRVICG